MQGIAMFVFKSIRSSYVVGISTPYRIFVKFLWISTCFNHSINESDSTEEEIIVTRHRANHTMPSAKMLFFYDNIKTGSAVYMYVGLAQIGLVEKSHWADFSEAIEFRLAVEWVAGDIEPMVLFFYRNSVRRHVNIEILTIFCGSIFIAINETLAFECSLKMFTLLIGALLYLGANFISFYIFTIKWWYLSKLGVHEIGPYGFYDLSF